MKKNKMLMILALTLGLAGLMVLNGCKTNDEVETKSIVETAINAGNFTTLVTALQASGLVDTLNQPGPFTVFAPTDEAFAKLPAGTIDALLNDIPALTNILLYHVSSGNYLASTVTQLTTLAMVNGSFSSISIKDGNAMIDNAVIIQTDIVCSNGVIHVIDAVILP